MIDAGAALGLRLIRFGGLAMTMLGRSVSMAERWLAPGRGGRGSKGWLCESGGSTARQDFVSDRWLTQLKPPSISASNLLPVIFPSILTGLIIVPSSPNTEPHLLKEPLAVIATSKIVVLTNTLLSIQLK